MRLELTRRGDYAVRAMVALAAAPVARYPALAWALHRQHVWQPLLDLTALLGAGGLIGILWALKAVLL